MTKGEAIRQIERLLKDEAWAGTSLGERDVEAIKRLLQEVKRSNG